MTVTDKYWLHVNRKHTSFDISMLFCFIIFGGRFSVIIATYYFIRIILYSTEFLSMDVFSSNKVDGLNQILIMPFTRKQIYNTYIKMMGLQAIVSLIVIALGQFKMLIFDGPHVILSDDQPLFTNIFTKAGYYLLLVCTLFILLSQLSSLINNYSRKNKTFLVLGSFAAFIYIVIINTGIIEYIRPYLSIQIPYFLFTLVFTFILFILMVKNIIRNYNKFLVRKGDLDVKENI